MTDQSRPRGATVAYAWTWSARSIGAKLSICVGVLTLFGIVSAFLISAKEPIKELVWFSDLFHLDRELNLPAWFQAVNLLFAACILNIITRIKTAAADPYRRHWKVLMWCYFLFSIDEAFSIHELFIIPDLNTALNLPNFVHYTWVIPGTVFVAFMAFWYFRFLLDLPRRSGILFVVAGSIYVSGALGVEMISGVFRFEFGHMSLETQLLAVFEEVMEMVGIVIWNYALLSYLALEANTAEIGLSIVESKTRPS